MRALLARIGTRATTQIYCYQISLQVFSVLLAYPLWPVELTVVAIAVRSYHHRLQHRSFYYGNSATKSSTKAIEIHAGEMSPATASGGTKGVNASPNFGTTIIIFPTLCMQKVSFLRRRRAAQRDMAKRRVHRFANRAS
ncbi:hypothetical protein L915_16577 [Phytophthora nicotianae]|uniref:Uncharacterized protein n=1 Tax=Phytophthora nicotianae TaxID=4792 RepID=W2G4J6_PHYNI|nr:hypothetical protein L915_16577 [Phytophthora nicotianae]